SMDFKRENSRVYLVGLTRGELGGSHYFGLLGREGGRPPRPDLAVAPSILRALHPAILGGHMLARHGLSAGGLAVAAPPLAPAGPVDRLGSDFDLDATRLYSESCSRFLVEVAETEAARFERALESVPCARVGSVIADRRLRITGSSGALLVDVALADLARAHR